MSDKIKPIPQPESDKYWEAANENKLLIQKFGDHIQFYPRAVSTKDGSRDVECVFCNDGKYSSGPETCSTCEPGTVAIPELYITEWDY